LNYSISGSAVRPLPRDGGMEELCGDPTVGPCPKVWTTDQKLCAAEAQVWDSSERGELDPAVDDRNLKTKKAATAATKPVQYTADQMGKGQPLRGD